MNAKKNQPKELIKSSTYTENTHLRVLSKQQRAQVGKITADWSQFTFQFYTKMFDKL